MLVHIREGKGKRDRNVPLSPKLYRTILMTLYSTSVNGSRRRRSAAPASTGMRVTILRSRLRYLTRGQRASARTGYLCPHRSLDAFPLVRAFHAPSLRRSARRQLRPRPGSTGRLPHFLSQTEGENHELFP